MSLESAQFDEPRYSVWLRSDLKLSETFDPLVDQLTDAIHSHFNLRERSDTREASRVALSVVLANLFRAHQRDPNLYVALSLSGNAYRRDQLNPFEVGYRGVDRIVDYLAGANLIERRRGGSFRSLGVRYTTRIRSKVELTDMLAEHLSGGQIQELTHRLTNDTSRWTSPHSVLFRSLFLQGELPLVRLKDCRKKLVNYEETPATEGMKRRLQSYNDFLRLQWIDLLLPNDDFGQVANGTFEGANEADEFGDSDENSRRVDLAFQRRLHRVFNNGTFDDGGRFYGGWWQNIPRRYRRYITINWAPVVELDYSNMQAAMLYAMEGRVLEGDAYALEGVDSSYRPLIKRTFFKLVNAEGRVRAPRRDALPPGLTWSQLQDAVRQKHSAIARHFNTGIGIRLQRVDSDIAEEVMMKMMEEGILVLPVHDSFLAFPAQKTRLSEFMKQAYRRHMGALIEIDADPSFIDEQFPDLRELDEAGVRYIEDSINDMELTPEYSDYRKRKMDFLADKDEAWRWRFYARNP